MAPSTPCKRTDLCCNGRCKFQAGLSSGAKTAEDKRRSAPQRVQAHLKVTIEYDKRDRYGRIVGKVLIAGDDANLKQVEVGLAWHYKAYEDEQNPLDRQVYVLTELLARLDHLGLWQDAVPIPPWEWRKGTTVANPPTGSCGRSCSQLGTCAAAMGRVRECGGGGIDGDGDGVPCESMCR
ncbi:MAG: thermonuclease family protein [Gammaproteobacteria bacterium]